MKPTDNSTPTKPTRRRAGLSVIFPETISHAFRQRQPRSYQLRIYHHGDVEAV